MKQSILILVFIVALIGGVVTGYLTLNNKVSADAKNPDFVFGIHMNAYPANTIGDPYQPKNVQKALDLAKSLGVSHLRINLEYYGSEPYNQVNDDLIAKVVKAGFEPVLIVESPLDMVQFFQKETYESGYNLGRKVGARYGSSITYYQIANEVSGMTIKPNHPGDKFSDYDPKKYEIVKNWLDGLSEGLKHSDSNAQRVISSHWLGIGVMDKLIEDKIDFEIIGWNWFSDMGKDPTNKVLDNGTVLNIPAHFATSGKKFWFTELNRSTGSYKNQEYAQAQFINDFWQNIKKSPYIHGLFAFTLVDIPPHVSANDQYWGFSTIKAVPGTTRYTLADPKLAFQSYQQIIAAASPAQSLLERLKSKIKLINRF